MVDAEPRVAGERTGLIVPEGVKPRLVGVNGAQGIGPALVDQRPVRRLAFGLEQGVARHRPA